MTTGIQIVPAEVLISKIVKSDQGELVVGVFLLQGVN